MNIWSDCLFEACHRVYHCIMYHRPVIIAIATDFDFTAHSRGSLCLETLPSERPTEATLNLIFIREKRIERCIVLFKISAVNVERYSGAVLVYDIVELDAAFPGTGADPCVFSR